MRTGILNPGNKLIISGITRYFEETGIFACRDVEISAEPGEILAIVGENGAGKSTLMNILCGTVSSDKGMFSVGGKPVRSHKPDKSAKAGIGMVHQHPKGAGELSVLENIILGYEPLRFRIFTDLKTAEKKVRAIQDQYGLHLDLNEDESNLNSAQVQRMELIHLLYMDKNILIFDEPTASLSDHQIDELLQIIFLLRDEGKTIIFISHKLNEVFKAADKIAVMRKGRITLSKDAAELTPEQISLEMVGESGEINYPIRNRISLKNRNSVLYSIEDLYYRKSDSQNLKGINLEILQGEILGIAGMRENGLELLEDIISGMGHPDRGKLVFHGEDVTACNPSSLRRKGISYVPADRLNRGVSTNSTIAENLILLNYRRMHKMGILAPSSINRWAEGIQDKYSIDGKPHQQIKHLSGGNIQKVILSRELRENPDLIIICEPSWGLDFRSRNNLHEELSQTAKRGTSILLISSDLDEILALSDRIAVLFDGKISVCRNKMEMNRTLIGEYMLGVRSTSEEN